MHTSGIHNITNEQYHSSHGYSRSQLQLFDELPFKFWYKYIAKLAEPEESKALVIGEAFHTLVQEPELFGERFVIAPEVDRRTKDGKAQWQAVTDCLGSMRLLTRNDFEVVKAMATNLRKQPFAHDILSHPLTKFEQSIYWVDEPTGLTFKVRPDIMNGNMIADLKSSKDASSRAFQGSCASYGYFLQAAMMGEALMSMGEKLTSFVFFVVEKDAPHATAFYVLDDEAITWGMQKFRSLADRLALALNENNWPDYGAQILTIPSYLRGRI